MITSSILDKIDFAKLYIEQKKCSSFRAKSVQDWDKRATMMNSGAFTSSYINDFLSKVNFNGVKTLLDFACGPGTLGLVAADKFEKIYMCDFSSSMLEYVKENAKNRKIANAQTIQIAFEDDWSEIPECDIVFASRCMEVSDVRIALEKLLGKAKKALYLTYKVGNAFISDEIINALPREISPRPDYIYIINILYQMGYFAKVDFIRTKNKAILIESPQDLIDKVEFSLGNLTNTEKEILTKMYDEKEIENENYMDWAFISVEK